MKRAILLSGLLAAGIVIGLGAALLKPPAAPAVEDVSPVELLVRSAARDQIERSLPGADTEYSDWEVRRYTPRLTDPTIDLDFYEVFVRIHNARGPARLAVLVSRTRHGYKGGATPMPLSASDTIEQHMAEFRAAYRDALQSKRQF